MNVSVTSVKPRGIGFKIKLSFPKKLLGLFPFLITKEYYCNEGGCVELPKYRAVKDAYTLNLLREIYNHRKKCTNINSSSKE